MSGIFLNQDESIDEVKMLEYSVLVSFHDDTAIAVNKALGRIRSKVHNDVLTTKQSVSRNTKRSKPSDVLIEEIYKVFNGSSCIPPQSVLENIETFKEVLTSRGALQNGILMANVATVKNLIKGIADDLRIKVSGVQWTYHIIKRLTDRPIFVPIQRIGSNKAFQFMIRAIDWLSREKRAGRKGTSNKFKFFCEALWCWSINAKGLSAEDREMCQKYRYAYDSTISKLTMRTVHDMISEIGY